MFIKTYLKKIIIFCLLLVFFVPKTSNAGLFFEDKNSMTIDIQRGIVSANAGFGDTTKTPEAIIAEIIKIALGFLGVIFIILTIYAGFLWMTAMGESDKIGTAKEIFISSITGLIIVLSAYLLTNYIFTSLGEAIGV
jgi:hypothetical protein